MEVTGSIMVDLILAVLDNDATLQIQNSNNADVLLDSGFNLFDIIVNLCSKLYYEVLLKSRNYFVNLLKQTLMFRT